MRAMLLILCVLAAIAFLIFSLICDKTIALSVRNILVQIYLVCLCSPHPANMPCVFMLTSPCKYTLYVYAHLTLRQVPLLYGMSVIGGLLVNGT
jgi:hypothetical protein